VGFNFNEVKITGIQNELILQIIFARATLDFKNFNTAADRR